MVGKREGVRQEKRLERIPQTRLERILSSAVQKEWEKVGNLPNGPREATSTVQLTAKSVEYMIERQRSRFLQKKSFARAEESGGAPSLTTAEVDWMAEVKGRMRSSEPCWSIQVTVKNNLKSERQIDACLGAVQEPRPP
jgi:hypothetical protein